MKVVLETRRLRLREMTDADFPAVASMLRDPEVQRVFAAPFSDAEVASWMARQMERYVNEGYGYWLAESRETGEVIAQAGVLPVEVEGVREVALGYIVGAAHRGRGYATEAARSCLDYAHRTLKRARVVTLIRPENAASLAVARKLGLERESEVAFAGFPHVLFSHSIDRPGPVE